MKRRIFYCTCMMLILLGACSRSVTRVSPDQQIDLSGRWNDTDSKVVADTMITMLMNGAWLEDFIKSHEGNKPKVIVGTIANKSHEHIDADTFIKDIEKAFINSGKVRVIENGVYRQKVREERLNNQGDFVRPEDQAQWGVELGANFMLFGSIISQRDVYQKKELINYKIDLWLTNMETNEKVWIGDKEIKKYIKN